MQKSKFIIFFILSFLSVAVVSHAAQTPAKPFGDIEVFVSGQRYQSFNEYRKARLRHVVEKIVPGYSDVQVDELIAILQQKVSVAELEGISEDQLRHMVQDFYNRFQEAQQTSRNAEKAQMQAMLDDYAMKTGHPSDLDIDFKKVKTITLGIDGQ